MSLYKEYVDTDRPNHKIKISLSFNKDSHSWATGQSKQKGYQVSCVPVEIGDRMESFGAFTGFNHIIYPVERQSKKRMEHAIQLVKDNKENLLDYFRNKGIKV
jgi:hypothetical protein